MDEIRFQDTPRLPRRLPKQPNEVFYVEEREPAPVAPPAQPAAHVPFQDVSYVEDIFPDVSYLDKPAPVFYPEPEIPAASPLAWQPHDPFMATDNRMTNSEHLPETLESDLPIAAKPPEPEMSDSKTFTVSSGDPKPAYVRRSGPSRSRPARPSRSFSAARPSGTSPSQESQRHLASSTDLRLSGELSSIEIPSMDAAFREALEESRSDSLQAMDNRASSSISLVRQRAPRRALASTVPMLIVLSALLVGYSFAIGSVESYLESLLTGAEGPSNLLRSLVPWIPLIPLLLLLGGVFWILAGLIGLRQKPQRERAIRKSGGRTRRKRESKRRKSPLEHFREEAAQEGIDGDAAYQAWRLLQPYAPDNHVLSIYDELQTTLGMEHADMQSIYRQLVPTRHHADEFHFRSVLDILRIVKQASLART